MFSIEFDSGPQVGFGEPVMIGRIVLNEFAESFVAPLVFWRTGDYQRQWREAAETIVRGGDRSCFVAAMRRTPDDGAIFLWPVYRCGEAVYVQHRLLLPETVDGRFDPANPYAQVNERQIVSEQGEPISEWQISVKDIALFLRRAG